MADKPKKPGVRDIKDLKAKLGLKKGGGGAVPAPPIGGDLAPPPGIAPPPTDDIAPPPGAVAPPAGDLVAPPGAAADPIVAPPGMAEPEPAAGGGLVAPPGYEPPPDPHAHLREGPPIALDDLDMGEVHGSGKRRIVWIIVAAIACLGALVIGHQIGNVRLKSEWVKATKKACGSTADMLKKLNKGVDGFEEKFAELRAKTENKGQKARPYYVKDFFANLSNTLPPIDVTDGGLQKLLNDKVWSTHYRFVKNAKDVLPRMHRLLAALAQLKLAVSWGRQAEMQFGKLLVRRSRDYKVKHGKTPKYGVLITGNKTVKFGVLEVPVDKKKKRTKIDEWAKAAGWRFVGAPAAFLYQGPPPASVSDVSECPNAGGTLRYFEPTDSGLNNVVKCTGQEDWYFAMWFRQIWNVQIILKEIKQLNLKDLRKQFLKSAG